MIWVILLTLLDDVSGQAPSSGRQGFCRNPVAGQAIFCDNLSAWDARSRMIDVPTGTSRLPALANGDQMALNAVSPGAIPPTKYDCLNWECVCNFVDGGMWDGSQCNLPSGGSLSNRRRSEIRTQSATYMARYAAAFLAAYNDIYSTLATIHSNVNLSPGAHSGPAFLPWHREFCKRLEIGIRSVQVNGQYPYWDVTIPYWDNTLDRNTQIVIGNSPFDTGSVQDGTLTDGIFGGWSGNQGPTQRSVDTSGVQLMQVSDISNMVATHTVNQVLAATAGGGGCPSLPFNTIELMHGNPHVFVGGDMTVITTSTNDPIFFNHHALIDCIWEEWRQARQTSAQRPVQYNTASTSCYSSAHRANAVMQPFSNGGFINTDGLSNLYTQNFYTYAPRPSPNNCPGPYLVVISGRCCARLRPFASCRRIGGIDPCYASTCSSTSTNWGTCTPPSSDSPDLPPLPTKIRVQADANQHENCFNNHECCAMWAEQGECKKNPAMRVACKAACGVCTLKRKCKDNCSDRHQLCKMFKEEGKCEKNPYFMNENCRKTCGACGKKRSEICTDPNYKPQADAPGKKASKPSKSKIPSKKKGAAPPKPKPSGCYNDNVCCEHWKSTVGCSKMGILTKVCQAACFCKPKYDPSSCDDFIKTCAAAKKQGLCHLDHIKETCRKTCGSCPSKAYMAKKC